MRKTRQQASDEKGSGVSRVRDAGINFRARQLVKSNCMSVAECGPDISLATARHLNAHCEHVERAAPLGSV